MITPEEYLKQHSNYTSESFSIRGNKAVYKKLIKKFQKVYKFDNEGQTLDFILLNLEGLITQSEELANTPVITEGYTRKITELETQLSECNTECITLRNTCAELTQTNDLLKNEIGNKIIAGFKVLGTQYVHPETPSFEDSIQRIAFSFKQQVEEISQLQSKLEALNTETKKLAANQCTVTFTPAQHHQIAMLRKRLITLEAINNNAEPNDVIHYGIEMLNRHINTLLELCTELKPLL